MSTYCPHCGASTQAGDTFCPTCGGRLQELANTALVPEVSDSPSAAGSASLNGETPADVGQPLVPDLSQWTDASRDASLTCPPEAKPKKDRTVRWIIIGVTAVALICCCCLASLMLLGWFGSSGSNSLVDLLRGLGIP